MSNQVLIAAPDAAARASAKIARSLHLTAVVAANEQEALDRLDEGPFRFIAVAREPSWKRVRAAAESKQPEAAILDLPDMNGDDATIRGLMLRCLEPGPTRPHFAEERYRFLSNLLESFTTTLELREVLRRIVTNSREELRADRGWLLRGVSSTMETATVAFATVAPGIEFDPNDPGPIQLAPSRAILRRAMEAARPIVIHSSDPDIDAVLAERYGARSTLLQILRPREGEPWAFGLHQATDRIWTNEEIDLFMEIGRYATLALNNTLLHDRAVREMAKVNAILDQIPEAAAIYDSTGSLERMNSAAQRDPIPLFTREELVRDFRRRGTEQTASNELPPMRALSGESVRADYVFPDARTGDERIVAVKAAPIRDDGGRIIGSVLLSRDVTEERQNEEREAWRRRRAECLASLGLENVTVQPFFEDLDEPARRVAEAVGGSAMIYLYHAPASELHMVGFASVAEHADLYGQYRAYLSHNPYHAGEGLAGTVFQIGRPLLFSDVRGNAVIDFGRNDEEKALLAALGEESLIACPIESYGDRIGALVIARSDSRRNFDAEDLEFAQSLADRIGAAAHIHRLTRVAQEGHRAAEELARREVDARVRFEAVLETAPIGIAVVSADELRFELANARWIEFASRVGKIPSDTKLIGLGIGDARLGLEKLVQQVADSGDMRVDEELEIFDGRHTMYVTRIISPVRGRFSGITQSLTILIQDVTDQVRAKREIEGLAKMMAERSARLDSILGSMTDGLWVYDASGNLVDVNQAALAMFGLGSRTEAIENASFAAFNIRYPDGKPVPPDDLPYARALRGMTVPDYLAIGRHLLTGHNLDLSVAAAPIESNGIVGAVLVIRDITALQELDRKKDEFLSVASHELRTPLTTVKGYTQLLAQTINDLNMEERSTYLTAVLGEIERMMGLISELLDVSRIETNRLQIQPQPIRWLEFVQRRVTAFRIQNPTRIIRFEPTLEESLVVTADPDRMRQVIDNLLSNAIKYSHDGTDIQVFTKVVDQSMLTTVADRGIGIPRDEIPHLFERFHRARNVSSRYYGGLGLGLYIAKAIIEAHDGSIHVESEEGAGSRFTIALPVEREP